MKKITLLIILLFFALKSNTQTAEEVKKFKASLDSMTTLMSGIQDSVKKVKGELAFEVQKERLVKKIKEHKEIKAFDFVGGGDLNSANSQGENVTAGNISLGLYMVRDFSPGKTKIIKDLEIDFALNVSSTLDSIVGTQSDGAFGSNVLQPVNNKFSARLEMFSLFRNNNLRKRRLARQKAELSIEEIKLLKSKLRKLKSKHENKIERRKQRRKIKSAILNYRELKRDSMQLFHENSGDDNYYTWFNDIFEGGYFKLYGDRTIWTRSDSLDLASTKVTNLQAKLGLVHEFLPNQLARESGLSVMMSVGYSLRAILGDIKQEKDLLKGFIGKDKSFYHGIDLSFAVKFDRIRAEFTFPFIFGSKTVPGLTNTQFIANVRFVGGFGLDFKKTKDIEKIVELEKNQL